MVNQLVRDLASGKERDALILTGFVQAIDWIVEDKIESYGAKVLGFEKDQPAPRPEPYLRETEIVNA